MNSSSDRIRDSATKDLKSTTTTTTSSNSSNSNSNSSNSNSRKATSANTTKQIPLPKAYCCFDFKQQIHTRAQQVPAYLCPPLSSFSDSFHTCPKATFTSSPLSTSPSAGTSLAWVPGRSVEKMDPNRSFTCT